NTLPPVKLVLMRLASIPLLLRLWGIVLFSNILGTILGTFVMVHTNMLSQEVQEAAIGLFSMHSCSPGGIFFSGRSLQAGWWPVSYGLIWQPKTRLLVLLWCISFFSLSLPVNSSM